MKTRTASGGAQIDWKPILLGGGGAGALMGLWWSLWLVGFLVANERGWLYPGIEVPPADPLFLLFSTETSLRWLADTMGIEPPKSLGSVPLSLAAIGWAFGAGIASVGRLLSIDPDWLGWKTLRWSLRGMLSPMVLLLCAVAPGIAGVFWILEPVSWSDSLIGLVTFSVLAGIMLVYWYVGVPLLICRLEIAESPRLPNWWRPRWPGWMPVAIFLGLALLTETSGVLEWLVPLRFGPSLQSVLIVAAGSFVWSAVLIAVPLVQCAVLMGLSEGVVATWRRLFSRIYLGPWIALGAWWCTAVLIIVPPALAVYVWLWKFLPVAASVHESLGSFLPYEIQLLVNALHFFGNFWWIFLAVPMEFAFWLGASRLLVLVRAVEKPRRPSTGSSETVTDAAVVTLP